MPQIEQLVQYLLANPLLLVPILVAVAMVVVAVLKRLLKLAAVIAVAGVLYLLLLEYFGTGI